MLPISENMRLGSLLSNLLQCTPARLSSKLRTGKVGGAQLVLKGGGAGTTGVPTRTVCFPPTPCLVA
jgi:hypothetical protein